MEEKGRIRKRINIQGAVQGVGFRPFIYREATALNLAGWVSNSPQGVLIEVEGTPQNLDSFLRNIETHKPANALIYDLHTDTIPPVCDPVFAIQHSESSGHKSAIILPDLATCPDCLRELFDPANRRYLYPFTNCTHCGPRFTIINGLPYDRPLTSMSDFDMCDDCRAEYENPLDRRFHAQPNACPICGPHLELWNTDGDIIQTHHDALLAAANLIRGGQIVAIKGLGGFHLMCDARNQYAVMELRQRKHREEKPFAVMMPSLDAIRAVCELSELEADILTSPQSPIVLLHRRKNNRSIVSKVAPENPYLGVMLPCTPLHHILMHELGFPMVATSGNLSDEPICFDEYEALHRLQGFADAFLVHNRPILRHVDDSVVRVINGRAMVMRRARGYAPLPVQIKAELPPILAVGGHLKNTIALASGHQVFISQHIGDLETAPAFEAFTEVIDTFTNLYDLKPETVVCDLHPDYQSTHYAESLKIPLIRVQHHYAHVLACMAEHGLDLEKPVLGVSWDGTGYGTDSTIQGGEFLHVQGKDFQRVAHLRTFALPGGEKAIKEPRRSAIGLLYEIFGHEVFTRQTLTPVDSFSESECDILHTMLEKGINSPRTSSAGRLFDAVAALIGLRQVLSFEGQAAMQLEFALDGVACDEDYQFGVMQGVIDWQPIILSILADMEAGISISVMSAKFHNTLAEMIVAVAQKIGEHDVILSGGCFQNKYLTERAIMRLQAEGFNAYWHESTPPNDGGIALGQIIASFLQIKE